MQNFQLEICGRPTRRCLTLLPVRWLLGMPYTSKTDEFLEKFQTAFDPPNPSPCVCSLWRDCCVFYDPIFHEMHVVQQFNMVLPLNWLKTYPKKTLLYHFHAEKALFKVQNLQHKFLDWK